MDPSNAKTLLSLPNEVLTEIAVTLPQKDLGALVRTNRFLHSQFNPYLYHRNATKHDGTALHWAARNQVPETVRMAVEAGVDVDNKEANTGYTPLIAAVTRRANDGIDVVAMVLYLLELGADIHAVENNRCSAFLMAAKAGADEIVIRSLLDLGAQIDAVDAFGNNALKLAVMHDVNDKVVEFMINRGVKMQNQGNGYSAFVAAVAKGRVGIVFSMLYAGANVDDTSANGTPLIMAAERGSESIVRLLIARGANVNTTRRDGSTALTRAIENGHAGIAHIFIQTPRICLEPLGNAQSPLNCAVRVGDAALIRFLIRHGADVNRCDAHGHSPLLLACYTGDIDITRLLLVRGADPNKPVESYGGQTPLHVAVLRSQWFLAKLLLGFGADASAVNNDEVPVIHLAAWKADEELVRFLVACGADVFAADALGNLPLMYAEGNNNHDVVEALRDAMARG